MRIIALDPGVTTGVAIYDIDTDRYEFEQLPESLEATHDCLSLMSPDVVLYEDFKFRPNLMKAETYSLQVIGVIKLWCEQRFIEPALTPLPAEAKAFWTDDKIKALGLWTKGLKHAMDALRVLLLYREKTDKEWFQTTLLKLR